jgi:hypothetical protein
MRRSHYLAQQDGSTTNGGCERCHGRTWRIRARIRSGLADPSHVFFFCVVVCAHDRWRASGTSSCNMVNAQIRSLRRGSWAFWDLGDRTGLIESIVAFLASAMLSCIALVP